MTIEKPGRNDRCPCGSGKKYKKCCLEKDAVAEKERQAAERAQAARESAERIGAARARSQAADDYDYADDDYGLDEVENEETAAWWKDWLAARDRADTDALIELMNRALGKTPGLAEQLDLHLGPLQDLGRGLRAQGRSSLFIELLNRVRNEFPRIHRGAFLQMDTDLVVELLDAGRTAEISGALDRIEKWHREVDEGVEMLLDILLATNHAAEAQRIARAAAPTLLSELGEMDAAFSLDVVATGCFDTALEARDTSEAAARAVAARMKACKLKLKPDLQEIRRYLEDSFGEFPGPVDAQQAADAQYAMRVSRHFGAYLHDAKGLDWGATVFFASELTSYLRDTAAQVTPDRQFPADPALLEEAAMNSGSYAEDGGVGQMAFLQTIWWFADYLTHHGLDESTTTPFREVALKLAKVFADELGKDDPGVRLLPDPRAYRWAAPRAG